MKTAARQHLEAERVASSGKRLQRPSDDPVDMQRAMLVRASKADIDIARKKASNVTDELLIADQAIGGMENAISRLREIAVQMSNDIMDASARLNASTEVSHIRDTVIRLGNTQFQTSISLAVSRSESIPLMRQVTTLAMRMQLLSM
jgi:flagellar hook-associated protein 3 FlgL